ncbi:MAG: sugar ABC transporter permease, partial [Spirochaetaceae bacterium]|nr:sugar ABC transporter permease [Spirochaetaceae bacterium]
MRKNRLERASLPWIYAFLLPSIVVFLVFYLGPIITVFATSFARWDGYNAPTFNGIKNYLRLFSQDSFRISLRNLLGWSVIAATLHVGFGVVVAFVFYARPFGWKVVRSVYMIPNIISAAAWAMIYKFMFNNEFGFLNGFIRLFAPGFKVNWFFQSPYAFWAITLTWLFYGVIVTLIVLADLMAIPQELHEAALIDGATSGQIALKIDLPMCRFSIGTGVILSMTSRIAMYEAIALTTRGGPGDDTMNVPIILVRAITDMNHGLANAAAVAMIVLGIATMGV